jgi:hypothetical protein
MSMVTRQQLGEVLRSAREVSIDPAMAAADWLARDIDPHHSTAVELLTDPNVSIKNLRKAKDVYKTMRILGESSNDRRVAARLYAATIGAGLIHHGKRISRQSDAALTRGLEALQADMDMPAPLRQLAGSGLARLGTL